MPATGLPTATTRPAGARRPGALLLSGSCRGAGPASSALPDKRTETPPGEVTSSPPGVSTVARRLVIPGSGRTSAERLHIAHAGYRAGAEVHLLVEAVGAEIAGRRADGEVAAAGDAGMVAGT